MNVGAWYNGHVFAEFNTTIHHIAYAYGWTESQTDTYFSLSNGICTFAAALGAYFSGYFARTYGRRKGIIYAEYMGLLGTVMTLIVNEPIMLTGRFL